MTPTKKTTINAILTLSGLLLLAGFVYYVNRNVKLEALYMDDLYMWSFYGEQNIFEFSFPFRTTSRFRPVYWLLTYLQMSIVGSHVRGYLVFNLVTNLILAFTVYGISVRISDSRIAAFLASVCFLASRLSYYQIGQALGFMETLACFFALWTLYFLYRFMTAPGEEKRKSFRLAITAYVLVSFTHERFIPLAGLFYVALLIVLISAGKGNRRARFREDLKYWIAPAAAGAAIMLIRFIFIGRAMPGGTGGSEVAETFSVSQTLRYCVSQVLYLLGINDGPEYLCAIPWENTPAAIKTLIKLSIVCYGLIGLGFIASMIADARKKRRDLLCRKLAVSLLFAGFIALCILCSSITIRVEMRWVYVSFAAMQIFACYMIRSTGSLAHRTAYEGAGSGESVSNGPGRINPAKAVTLVVFLTYVFLSVRTNVFCRGYIDNIYFMEGQNRANNIAEETIYKFGADEVLGKTVFLIDTTYSISDFYAAYFFKPFDPEKTGQGSALVLVDTLEEALQYLKDHPATGNLKAPKTNPDGNISERAIFLTEDRTSGRYVPMNVVN